MNTILKLCSASALFFSISQPLAHASLCGEGVPDGTLQVQLDFLIACEPASGPKSAGLQARQDGNGSTHSPGSSGARSSNAGGSASSLGDTGGEGGGGSGNRGAGANGGGTNGGAGAGTGSGSGNSGNGGAGSGNGQGSTADDAGRGDHGKRGQGNNGLGNGGGDGSPNGKDDNKR